MNEKQLRNHVVKRVGRLSDDVWESLKEDRLVYDALRLDVKAFADDPMPNELVDLCDAAEDKMRLWRKGWETHAGRPIPSGRHTDIKPRFNKRESLRIAVLSQYYAKVASEDPAVRRFRANVLHDHALSEEEALRFIASPAAQHASLQDFTAWGIDPVEHIAEVIAQPSRGDRPPFHRTVRVSAADGSRQQTSRWPLRGDHVLLPFQDGDEPLVAWMRAWPGSVLHDLWQIGKQLASTFPWSHDQATMYILCRGVPEMQALQITSSLHLGQGGPRWVITMTAEVWAPDEVAHQAYRALQHHLLGGSNRLVDEKGLQLFWFVEQHTDADRKRPTWQWLTDEWNHDHPEWSIGNRSNLRQRYMEVRKNLFPTRLGAEWATAMKTQATGDQASRAADDSAS